MGKILFLKAYVPPHLRNERPVKGYFRKDRPKNVAKHPQKDHHGETVTIKEPSTPTALETWTDPDAVATVVPGGAMPAELNGVALAPWSDHPHTDEGWEYLPEVDDTLDEPPFHAPKGKHASAGVIIREPDGRVWLTHPTNAFGGYKCTFPKGTAEEGMSLQATAVRETFEETGLKVRIVGFLGDFHRTTSVARIYLAERVGGTPAAAGWESQAVSLCPVAKLYDALNMHTDHDIAEALGAGVKPPPPAQKFVPTSKGHSGSLFDL